MTNEQSRASAAIDDKGGRTITDPSNYLYGTPGAEHMEFDAESVLEHQTDDEIVVEEWTVRHPRTHLPTAGLLLDWLAESDYEVTEDWWESATDATAQEDVRAAAEALLDLFASHITYRMADRHIANLRYRWNGDEDDGEYVMVAREITAEGERLAEASKNGRSAP